MDLVFFLYSCGLLYHCIDLSAVQKRIPGMNVNFQLSFCLFSLFLIFQEKIGCYELMSLKKSREILTRNQTYLVLKIACFYMTLPERNTGKGRMWMDFLGHIHSWRFISLELWLDNAVLDKVLFKSNEFFFFPKKYCYLFFSKFSWNITMWRNLSSGCVLPVTSCGKEHEVYTTAEKKKESVWEIATQHYYVLISRKSINS